MLTLLRRAPGRRTAPPAPRHTGDGRTVPSPGTGDLPQRQTGRAPGAFRPPVRGVAARPAAGRGGPVGGACGGSGSLI